MPSKKSDLPKDVQAFISEYMQDLNGEEAAERLGQPREAAARLLRIPGVPEAIAEKLAKRAQRTVGPARILGEVLRRERGVRQGLIKMVQVAAARRGILIQRIPNDMRTANGHGDENDGAEVYGAYWDGRCFYFVGDGPIAKSVLRGEEWDPHTKKVFRDICTRDPDGTVVEVGANIGASFITECADHPKMRFILIEPLPIFHQVLEKNRESFGATNAELHRVAISDGRGDMVLVYDQTSGGVAAESSLLGTPRAAVTPTKTLDELVPEGRISLLKVDVDGFELDVFRGGANVIQRSRPEILFEYNPIAIEVRGFDPIDLLRTLSEWGIGVFDVYSDCGVFVETIEEPELVSGIFRSFRNPLTHLDIHARTCPSAA